MKRVVVLFWFFYLFFPTGKPRFNVILMPDEATCNELTQAIAENNPTLGVSECQLHSVCSVPIICPPGQHWDQQMCACVAN